MILQFPTDTLVKLEDFTYNDRSIVVWYDRSTSRVSFMLFHLTDQINDHAKKSPYTTWGYCTGIMINKMSIKESGEVISRYIQDLENENYWWEV